MAWADDLKRELDKAIPTSQLHYLDGWKREWYRASWAANGGKPLALLLHHTAGAATASQDKNHPGNQHGANDGQVRYVNRHPSYGMPASQFTLDRDGCIYVNAALPCYHAGSGSFSGTQWSSLGIPKDSANSYLMGVECVSKGQEPDFTAAMKQSLARLAAACSAAAGWGSTATLRLPRHKDWTTRKVDIKYSNSTVQEWMAQYGPAQLWDGVVPDLEAVQKAEADPTLMNKAAWRVACRLDDLGFYQGTPKPCYEQGYPRKAVVSFQQAQGWEGSGKYGEKTHSKLFP